VSQDDILANKPLVVFRLRFRFIFMIFVKHNSDFSPQTLTPLHYTCRHFIIPI